MSEPVILGSPLVAMPLAQLTPAGKLRLQTGNCIDEVAFSYR